MRINFYEAMLSEDRTPMLVKEKGVNYGAGRMDSPKEAALMMQELLHMDKLAEEHCYLIALNSSCKTLGIFLISKGTVNASLIAPREVYIRALLAGAVQIILCHNHPSGDASPSRQDAELTKRIRETGGLINIPLADHIIIGGDTYFSFKEAGML
jgi:DNA repair proteins